VHDWKLVLGPESGHHEDSKNAKISNLSHNVA